MLKDKLIFGCNFSKTLHYNEACMQYRYSNLYFQSVIIDIHYSYNGTTQWTKHELAFYKGNIISFSIHGVKHLTLGVGPEVFISRGTAGFMSRIHLICLIQHAHKTTGVCTWVNAPAGTIGRVKLNIKEFHWFFLAFLLLSLSFDFEFSVADVQVINSYTHSITTIR